MEVKIGCKFTYVFIDFLQTFKYIQTTWSSNFLLFKMLFAVLQTVQTAECSYGSILQQENTIYFSQQNGMMQINEYQRIYYSDLVLHAIDLLILIKQTAVESFMLIAYHNKIFYYQIKDFFTEKMRPTRQFFNSY